MRFIPLILFISAILLYSNTFNHGYVFDDHELIDDNGITMKGFGGLREIFSSSHHANINFAGDNLYRPISKGLFAIEWEIWPDNPMPAHIINVLLFAAACVLLYSVLSVYLKDHLLSFVATAIFLTHPVHTEVVANIKSADEILSLLFSLLSLLSIYKYLVEDKKYYLLLSGITLFLAIMSKESAVLFLGIIPLTIYFFMDVPLRKNVFVTFIHLIPVIVFLYIRYRVVGGIDTPPELNMNSISGIESIGDRIATAVMILGYYLWILIFPAKLMSDGSYNQFPAVSVTDITFLIPAAIFLGALIYSIIKLKHRSIPAYAILFFFITVSLASNIFILIGTNYAERLLFTPSIAICLLVGWGISRMISIKDEVNFFRANRKALITSLLIIIPFSARTITRSADWKSDLVLFQEDVDNAPYSARAHYYLGNQWVIHLSTLTDEKSIQQSVSNAKDELKKSINILEEYDEAWYSFGQVYSYTGDLDSALFCYGRAATISPGNARFQNNYGDILFRKENYFEANKRFRIAVGLDSLYSDAFTNLGTSYARIGQSWLESAQQAQAVNDIPETARTYNLAMAYYDSAIVSLNRSIELNAESYLPYQVLGIIYQNKGEADIAREYYSKAESKR